MTKISAWLIATRPRTLTATLAPLLVGTSLAYQSGQPISVPLVICALFCALSLQIATNLVNDVSDFQKGTDTAERLGPPRATSQGWLTPRNVWAGATIALTCALLTGLPLMMAGGPPLMILGILCLIAAVAYTAGPFPLAYHGLGEIFVLIFFGWVAVGGLAFALTKQWMMSETMLAGTQIGLLSVTMIAINNLRDIEGDKKSGKKTLAARFGERFTRALIGSAMFCPYVIGILWWPQSRLALFLPLITLPFAIKLWGEIQVTRPSVGMNPLLGKSSLHLLIFSILLSVGLIWT